MRVHTNIRLTGILQLTYHEQHVLNFLYQPLLDGDSFRLYFFMMSHLSIQKTISTFNVCDYLKLSDEAFMQARYTLEKCKLIETYQTDDFLVIRLMPPKTKQEFMSDVVLSRYFIAQNSQALLQEALRYVVEYEINIQGKNISAQLSAQDFETYDTENEAQYYDSLHSKDHLFDLEKFMAYMNPQSQTFPKVIQEPQHLKVIQQLANRYLPPFDQLRNKILKAITVDNEFNHYTFEQLFQKQTVALNPQQTDVFKYSCEQFLQYKKRNVPLQASDFKKIVWLRELFFNFDDEMINVIVDYVLETTKGLLPKSYLEQLSTSFAVMKVHDMTSLKDYFKKLETNNFVKQKQTKPQIDRVEYETSDLVDDGLTRDQMIERITQDNS